MSKSLQHYSWPKQKQGIHVNNKSNRFLQQRARSWQKNFNLLLYLSVEQTEVEHHAETLRQELTHQPLELSAKHISHHSRRRRRRRRHHHHHLLILLLSLMFNRYNFQVLLQVGKGYSWIFFRMYAFFVAQDLTNSVKALKNIIIIINITFRPSHYHYIN